MGAKFKKFVESSTDSRYIPLGTCCSLCGKKLGFFRTGFWSINAGKLADGVMCEKCKEKVERLLVTKRKWMKAKEVEQCAWKVFNSRNIQHMPVQTAQEMLDAKGAADRAKIAGFGNGKTGLFTIEEAVQIMPNALQVGIVRAKRLKNKVVVFETMECGEFSKGCRVEIPQGAGNDPAVVLEAYVYDSEENTLEICLRANMGKQRLRAGEKGWLVLDYEKCVEVGNPIVG